MPQPSETNPNLFRMVVITSLGLTPSTHQSLPLLLRPVYSYLLDQPHKDKLGVERLAFHCMGREWPSGVPEPAEDIMGSDWANREGLPKFGSFSNVLIVRPALLTDGECVGTSLGTLVRRTHIGLVAKRFRVIRFREKMLRISSLKMD